MSDTNLDVKYVAHLARLELTSEEERQFESQIGEILNYVEKLKELDVSHIEPTAHVEPMRNITRPDVVRPSIPHEEALRNAPAQLNGLFLVPKIIE